MVCYRRWVLCVSSPNLCAQCYAEAPEAFALSFSSIFLLAARIISSLFLCRLDWRSVRSALHALVLGFSSAGSGVWLSFDVRLYRVMRSGCDGLAAAATGLVGAAGAGAAGSWNDAGACRMSVLRCLSAVVKVDLRCPEIFRPAPFQS